MPAIAAGTHADIIAMLIPFISNAAIKWLAARTMMPKARALMMIWVISSRMMRRESFT